MNILPQKNKGTLLTSVAAVTESESIKEQIKTTVLKVENPPIRYLNLIDDTSPSYVLGYN